MANHSMIKIPIGQWCALCDALHVAPDTSTEDVVEKARLLYELLIEARKKLAQAHPGGGEQPGEMEPLS